MYITGLKHADSLIRKYTSKLHIVMNIISTLFNPEHSPQVSLLF